MTKRIFLTLSMCAIMTLFMAACQPAAKPLSKEKATAVVGQLIPGATVIDVKATPIMGLWEVSIDAGGQKGIAYVDSDGKSLVLGSIVDIETKVNLTEVRFEQLNLVDFSTIPLEDAIVMGDKNAPHKVAVFVDPDCPYCNMLHKELKTVVEQMPSVAFYFKVGYIKELHPEAYEVAKAIICEKDNAKAMEMLEAAYEKKPLPKASCETTVVDSNVALMEKLNIEGTPTMILDTGKRIDGAAPADQIIEILKEAYQVGA